MASADILFDLLTVVAQTALGLTVIALAWSAARDRLALRRQNPLTRRRALLLHLLQ